MSSEPIGHLERICRFPVKSMAGEDLSAVYVHETGLNGDRIFAYYDHSPRRGREGLPYLTGREEHGLVLLKPEIVAEPDHTQPYPERFIPQVQVRTPKGEVFDIRDPILKEYLTGLLGADPARFEVDYHRAGIHDQKAISVMGLETIKTIGTEAGVENLDPLRFRENFYIRWKNQTPFFEDTLVGQSLHIGNEVIIHVAKRNARCPMICIDPTTGEYDKRVLGIVAKKHDVNAGVYAMVRRTGTVRLGDEVRVVGTR